MTGSLTQLTSKQGLCGLFGNRIRARLVEAHALPTHEKRSLCGRSHHGGIAPPNTLHRHQAARNRVARQRAGYDMALWPRMAFRKPDKHEQVTECSNQSC